MKMIHSYSIFEDIKKGFGDEVVEEGDWQEIQSVLWCPVFLSITLYVQHKFYASRILRIYLEAFISDE